jgi:streptogramin lyase
VTPEGIVALNGGGAFYFQRGNLTSGDGSAVLGGIATDAGELREYGIPTHDEIESVAVGPRGTLWASTILDSKGWPPVWHGAIVRIAGTQMTAVFRIPNALGYSPALVIAPHGDIWFALPDAHAVGNVTDRGKLQVKALSKALKPNALALLEWQSLCG